MGQGVLDETLNVTTQLLTGGLAGYGEGGFNMSEGVVGEHVVEGTKEITGANAAEEANEIAREQYEAEQEAAKQALANQQQADKARNLQASQNSTAGRSATTSTANRTVNLSGGATDFLGL